MGLQASRTWIQGKLQHVLVPNAWVLFVVGPDCSPPLIYYLYLGSGKQMFLRFVKVSCGYVLGGEVQ